MTPLGATILSRDIAEALVEFLAACPAHIPSEVVEDGKYFRVKRCEPARGERCAADRKER
jgi:hypothetical protein